MHPKSDDREGSVKRYESKEGIKPRTSVWLTNERLLVAEKLQASRETEIG